MRPGKKILTYVVIFLTAWLSALSYILFVFPNNFAPAGINGLCTMIQYALGIRVSIMNLLVNLPLALLVYKIVSRPVAIRSMIYSASFPWPWQFWSMCPWNNLPTPQKTEPAPSWALW